MKGVSHGRHAVALNEKRSKFRTNMWEPENGCNFAQVWFAGVHADVGGSYRESGLSDVARMDVDRSREVRPPDRDDLR